MREIGKSDARKTIHFCSGHCHEYEGASHRHRGGSGSSGSKPREAVIHHTMPCYSAAKRKKNIVFHTVICMNLKIGRLSGRRWPHSPSKSPNCVIPCMWNSRKHKLIYSDREQTSDYPGIEQARRRPRKLSGVTETCSSPWLCGWFQRCVQRAQFIKCSTATPCGLPHTNHCTNTPENKEVSCAISSQMTEFPSFLRLKNTPLYIYTDHIFFIHSSTDGHLGCSHYLGCWECCCNEQRDSGNSSKLCVYVCVCVCVCVREREREREREKIRGLSRRYPAMYYVK